MLSSRLAEQLGMEARREEYALLFRFAGSSRTVVTQTAQALKVLREDRNHHCATHGEDAKLWRELSTASLQSADDLVWRATMRPTELPAFLDEMAALETDEVSQARLRWHAGLGDGRVRAIGRAPVYHREAVRALERMRQRAENLGGSLIVEKAPLEIKNEIDAWGDFGSASELMRRVKTQFDPENILSPGRMFA